MARRAIEGVLLALFLMLWGCTYVLTDFRALSTTEAPFPYKTAQPAQGRSCHHLLFGVIPLTDTPSASLKQTINRALEAGGGTMLVNGLVYDKQLIIPFLYHRRCYVVEGTAATLIPRG